MEDSPRAEGEDTAAGPSVKTGAPASPRSVFSSVPQYAGTAVVSGICSPSPQHRETPSNSDSNPKGLCPSTPVNDPSDSCSGAENVELIDNFTSIDQDIPARAPGTSGPDENEDETGISGSTDPHSSQEYLLRMKEQARSQVQARKDQHLRSLSHKKHKLQRLLQKLDTTEGSQGQDPGWTCLGEREGPPDTGESREEDRALVPPAERQREGGSERSTQYLLGSQNTLHSNTADRDEDTDEDRDGCDHAINRSNEMMHRCWRKIFQTLSFPFNLASVFLIELVNFITRFVVKVLAGLVAVFGQQVIAPLFGALLDHAIPPLARFLLNISLAVRDILHPLLAVIREVFLHVALLVQSFRLVEVNIPSATPHSRQEV